MDTLRVRRLRGATIFRLVLVGNILGMAATCTILAVPASLGTHVLKWNGEHVTGAMALLAGPFTGAFVGLILGLFTVLPVYVGLRLYSLWQGLDLEYVPLETKDEAAVSGRVDSDTQG